MFSRTAAFVAGIALASSLVFAQGFTGTITGTVKDESGAVLQGAVVTAKHTETGLTRAAITVAGGSYSIPSLPVGAYEITAQEPGFKMELLRGIDLLAAQEAVVNVTLQVGNVQQQVTVAAEAPLVNTTLASTSGLIPYASSDRSSGSFVVRTKEAAERNPAPETSGGAWMGPLRAWDL